MRFAGVFGKTRARRTDERGQADPDRADDSLHCRTAIASGTEGGREGRLPLQVGVFVDSYAY